MFDTVSSVLSVFNKLIVRLEKIQEKQKEKRQKLVDKQKELDVKIVAAKKEQDAAEKAITKLKAFVE